MENSRNVMNSKQNGNNVVPSTVAKLYNDDLEFPKVVVNSYW